jgi:CubicO group peptidase (beta-lactamase class C family)
MFPDEKIFEIRKILENGVENNVFSAAQAAWWRGTRQALLCVGDTFGKPVKPRTRFDIASVTKVFAASACLRLADRGVLRLDAPIGPFSPSSVIQNATIAEVLCHEAGFASWLPLFDRIPPTERGSAAARQALIDAALKTLPVEPAGVRCIYSDLGFIALTRILEDVTGQRLDRIISDEVLKPLHLEDTAFRPTDSSNVECDMEIAPTAISSQHTSVICGQVHDDNARTMGGVSAHAGLFSTASDISAFGRCWLSTIATGTWLSTESAKTAIQRRPLGRGLGWDLKSEGASSAGTKMSRHTFGHLGFTGCSLWVDPERGLSVALLTNRVCYGNDNDRIRSFRPLFHDALIEMLDDETD